MTPSKAKSGTKVKILDAALGLFNNKGTENVTVRHIAAALDMSHGNLCYHYPTREDIVFALYENLVEEFNARLALIDTTIDSSFKEALESIKVVILLFYKYRFLMLDFVSVMRSNEKIKMHYRELMKLRKIEMAALFRRAIAAGFMRQERFEGEFNHLTEVMSMVGDYWIAHSEIHFDGTQEEKINYYNQVLFNIIAPYLTDKGWKEIS